MRSVLLGLFPSLHGIEASVDVVRRIVCRTQGRAVDATKQIGHAKRRIAIDPVLVLVEQHDAVLVRDPGLGAQAANDLVAVEGPVFRIEVRIVAWWIVTENPDVWSPENAAKIDGPLELIQMRLEWSIYGDLADG